MKSFFSLSVVLCSALLAQADYLPNHYNIQPTKPGASSSGAPVPTEPCVFRPTQTITATADPACATTCATVAQCYADSAITLDCGCSTMDVQPTTTTVCPTTDACTQCTTAWGIAVVTPTTCPTAAGTPVLFRA